MGLITEHYRERTGTGACPYDGWGQGFGGKGVKFYAPTGHDGGHLYQLIHHRDRFAVPPSFREAIANRAIPKVHQRKPSSTARKSVSQRTFVLQPTLQANACRSITKAICAVLAPRRMRAAFLNCSGSCTPLAYFFLLLKKSRSPKASKATNNALEAI